MKGPHKMDTALVFGAGVVAALAAAGAWVVAKKGWGWVLAKLEARKATAAAKAKATQAALLAPVTSSVTSVVARVEALEHSVQQIKNAVKIP